MIRQRCLALLLSVVVASAARAADAPRHPSPEVPAEKFFKNIQALKGVPSSELMGAMRYMSASLGMRCERCHVTSKTANWPMEKDDKAAKRTAREMITMTRDINAKNFEGKMIVTCATCHMGRSEPAQVPPIRPDSGPAQKDVGPAPSTKETLARHEAAVGGRARFEKLATVVARGTVTTSEGQTFPIEIDRKAPDRIRVAAGEGKDAFARHYDGSLGWNVDAERAVPMGGEELVTISRQAAFLADFDPKSSLPMLVVTGPDRIDGRPVIVAEGRGKDGHRETLFFDAGTNLLARRMVFTDTILGKIPEQFDYSDYRDVAGVKLPFRIVHARPSSRETETFREILVDTPLPDETFQPTKK